MYVFEGGILSEVFKTKELTNCEIRVLEKPPVT
jgi:hypothetical protein